VLELGRVVAIAVIQIVAGVLYLMGRVDVELAVMEQLFPLIKNRK
jgi:hypothetical protein